MKKLTLILLLFTSINLYSAGPPCQPFSPCWCMQNPQHPKCIKVGVPINGEIGFLILAGLCLGIWYYKKKNTKNKKEKLKEILSYFKGAEIFYTNVLNYKEIYFLYYVDYGLCIYFKKEIFLERQYIYDTLEPYWYKYKTKKGLFHFKSNEERLEAIKKVIKDLEKQIKYV